MKLTAERDDTWSVPLHVRRHLGRIERVETLIESKNVLLCEEGTVLVLIKLLASKNTAFGEQVQVAERASRVAHRAPLTRRRRRRPPIDAQTSGGCFASAAQIDCLPLRLSAAPASTPAARRATRDALLAFIAHCVMCTTALCTSIASSPTPSGGHPTQTTGQSLPPSITLPGQLSTL